VSLDNVISIAIPLVLVVVLFINTGGARPLRLGQLWITPAVAIVSIITGLVFQNYRALGAIDFALVGTAAVIGLTTGLLRAGTVKLWIDQSTGKLFSRTQSYALILFIILAGLRYTILVHNVVKFGPVQAQAVFYAAMVFALTMIISQRIGIFRRALVLLKHDKSLVQN